MSTRRPTLSQLKDEIGGAIRDAMSAHSVESFCVDELGLDPAATHQDDPMTSKRAYVVRRLQGKSESELLDLAGKVLAHFEAEPLESIVAKFQGQLSGGVDGNLKNIIFAADGPKPEFVLSDSLNNDVQIVKNAEFCLVFDEPLRESGLSWRDLVSWWRKSHPEATERDAALTLHKRLLASLNKGPEKAILTQYASLYKTLGYDIPALLPQVYLHFDPYTARERRSGKHLARERMDFLLLLPARRRIVIELDGVQHYADDNRMASPTLYADMVRADRELRLAGYEVFRFGGYEFVDPAVGARTVKRFFERLLELHKVAPKDTGPS